ncbi:MAG: peptidoglycan editing factor PgeF [Bauldia sp.]|uniref:peptidoglycan editing factor PgeF n=1 Tax=Bauldia sp. TaxID=2575872 RepID=UPI001DFB55B6|nr:peptidoglycan editing factor PgeF [Bauldia sp.]MCB1498121.1 peptidoglycan editing factor PgeF [Bauldia sp.]
MLRSGRVSWSGEAVKPRPLTHGLLDAISGIRYGFFTREGGVSSSIYQSLNCGVGSKDDKGFVFKNRARAARSLGVGHGQLATPYQIHSNIAMVVDEVWEIGQGPKADAVVTNRSGIAIGVGTADCGPVLFADPAAHVIGAAHAGWKGALAGILDATVATMEGLGADRDRIVAVLGPTISQANYEVGADLIAAFEKADPANARFFRPSTRDGHAMFDLPGYIIARLLSLGVLAADLGLCTYADEDRFFSYRRATHRGENDYGRLLSAITLE